MKYRHITLLVEALGVIVADNPESTYVAEVEDLCVVSSALVTTWRTVPFVGVVAAMYRQADPFQMAIMSVSVS
jgi:hypothetical protein